MNHNSRSINTNLLNQVKKRLPDKVNLANYLMDILFIGKESIYRRIRGEVPFTLYEAGLIAKKIGISLDKIVGFSTSNNAFFELRPNRFYDFQEEDYLMYEEYLELLKLTSQDPHSELAFACNVFPQYPSLLFEPISRLHSLKWAYLNKEKDYNITPYHEMVLPERFVKVMEDVMKETMKMKQTYYIWDKEICQDIVNDIKYFASINLILEDDVKLLKEELLKLADKMESFAIKGEFAPGNKVQIYVTNTNFDTTYYYMTSESMSISLIGAFASNYVAASDKESFKWVKSRIHALKKISTQISESGEAQRINFFEKQRIILNTL